MNDFNKTAITHLRVKNYMLMLMIFWTVMVAASLMWNLHQTRQNTLESARIQARSAYEKDLAYRFWNAGHGGVYVPVTKTTQPNPYLSNIPERDITIGSGKLLTLMNPAYMTRQVYELTAKRYGVRSHITSLRPIRPQNAADPWETGALQAFEHRTTEISSVEDIEGKEYMRLMRPLFTGEVCLKCHGAQGYRAGDIRGGISISVPMADLRTIERRQMLTLWLGHSILLLLGLGGIGVGTLRFRERVRERDRLEKVLREREERYRGIFDESVVAIYVFDKKKRFIDSNQAGLDLLGYSRDELLSMSIPDIDADPIVVLSAHEKLISGDRIINYEHKLKRKDGEVITVLNNSRPLTNDDEQVVGMQSTLIDITERKIAEQALQESEERHRSLVECSSDAILVLDVDRKIVSCNRAFLALFGYDLSEVIGQSTSMIHPSEESYRSFGDAAYLEIKRSDSFRAEWEFLRRDGAVFPAETTTSAIKLPDGETTGYVAIIRDISERKRTEKALRESEEKLARSKKMEAIGTLAGGVAHDLNNILSGIVSYPELILMDLPEESPLRKPISTIQKSGEKAAVVVQDLLTLARRGVAITGVVNLNQIISEQLKSPEFEKLMSYNRDVKVETHFEKDILNIKGSSAHLSKSVMNLVSNAAEAMPGGGTIFIYTENRYIDRPVKGYDHVEEGDYVIVTVFDTGIGMSSEDMERIFEPFYTKKAMGRSGTGLGMAVVWGTVKDHNGYIDLKSTEGKGSTFTLYFPVTREEVIIDTSLLAIEDYKGRGETILVIDDVEEQRDIASGMLRKLGYSVTSVSSGEEAVEYMKNETADLLVLDMIMDPGIDGLETYKRILALHPGQKAVIASGFSETDRVKEAMKLGAGAYIKKPYLIEKIGLAVRKECAGR